MQWTNTGAVKGALHFHRPIFTFESGGADRPLFFCRASSSSPVLKAGLIWAGIIFAGVASGRQRFHRYPLNHGGIWLSGSLTVFTSRLGSPPLLARPICRLRASFVATAHGERLYLPPASRQ